MMLRSEIVSVWGKADAYSVTFEKRENLWVCSVPTDLSDGAYECCFYAKNEKGTVTSWTGTLYMCSGICRIDVLPFTHTLMFKENKNPVIAFERQNFEINFIKECKHLE
ncbi:MAG: hypothetical protein ACI4VI_07925 [Acutalibacteraceae bacterium]